MKKIISVLAVGSAVFLTGCGSMNIPVVTPLLSVLGATPERMQAGRSGCDPRSPMLKPFTAAFNQCKESFPNLAADYKAKEDRKAAGDCNVYKGDAACEANPYDQKFGWERK